MSTPVLKSAGSHRELFSDAAERKALAREKAGVMGGFVIGVLGAVGVIEPSLSASLSNTGVGIAGAALIAACTWVGYRLGTAPAPHRQG